MRTKGKPQDLVIRKSLITHENKISVKLQRVRNKLMLKKWENWYMFSLREAS